ncbi:MAG: glycosyltransferase [Bacteroidaceae bacterium]|nr:glycosyltransferase [Bacteroidaceae bacterium]
MMKTPKISVIIPIYNAENYLHNCINSFIQQTYTNLEIILINDGSTDKTPDICDKFALTDSRIKVIHKKNEGVACARQAGLDVVTGEYTIHADSDDHVHPKMIESLLTIATKENADVVICDFYIEQGEKITIKKQEPTPNGNGQQMALDILSNKIHGSLCNKLIKTEIIKNSNVKFIPMQNYCEDVLFLLQLSPYINKVSYLQTAFYYYNLTNNPLSLTKLPTQTGNEQRLNYYQCLKDIGFYETLPLKKREKAISLNAYISFANNFYNSTEFQKIYKPWQREVWNGGHWYHKICNRLCLCNLMWVAKFIYKLFK